MFRAFFINHKKTMHCSKSPLAGLIFLNCYKRLLHSFQGVWCPRWIFTWCDRLRQAFLNSGLALRWLLSCREPTNGGFNFTFLSHSFLDYLRLTTWASLKMSLEGWQRFLRPRSHSINVSHSPTLASWHCHWLPVSDPHTGDLSHHRLRTESTDTGLGPCVPWCLALTTRGDT